MIKKKIWTGNTDLEVINILMLLEAMKLKCTNKREFKKKEVGGGVGQDGILENTNIKKAYRKLTEKKNGGDQRDAQKIKGVYNHKSSEEKAFQEEESNGVKF